MTSRKKTPLKRKPRAKGRPDATGSVGPDLLIESARKVLQNTPPQALTLAAVAKQAGVHPALVRYYFGGKDGLLTAVTRQLVEGEQDVVRPALERDAPLEEKLAVRLRGMIELIENNPHFHRLVLDQIYEKSAQKQDPSLLTRVTERGTALTAALIASSKHQTTRSVDPRFLHIALIGLTEFFTTVQPLLEELFGADADRAALKEDYIHFLVDLMLHGLLLTSANPN